MIYLLSIDSYGGDFCMHKKLKLDSLMDIAKNNVFIVFIFAVMSLASSVLLWKSHFIPAAGDLYFHFQRITEMKDSLSHGILFQDVAITKFDQSGSAAMTMYPKINIIPFVLLSFLLKNMVHLVYTIFILRNFFALILAYLSCYSYKSQKSVSFVFAITYTLSTMVLNYAFNFGDMGVTSSLIYLPLVLFGTLNLLHKNSWIELSIGMIGVLSSHVITSVMSIGLVCVLLLLNIKIMKNKEHVFSLIKAILLTLCITAVFWMPFLVISIRNHIGMPFVVYPLSGVDFNTLMASIFNNSVTQYITIFAFIGIILSILNYKKMSNSSKQLFFIAIILIVVCSSFVPWNLLNNTFIKSTFQFSWRVLLITQLLLCYLFAENAINLCKNKKQRNGIVLLIVMTVMCSQIVGQRELIDTYRNNTLNTDNVVSGKNYYLIYDYYPKEAASATELNNDFRNHLGYYGRKRIMMNPMGNGIFTFKLSRNVNNFRIPFLIYNGINYNVKVDGKNVKFYSDEHSQLTLYSATKGKHRIQVIVKKSWYDYFSYLLCFFGILSMGTYLYIIFSSKIRKK